MPDELPPLACTVRACALALRREAQTLVCQAGHRYDLARRGYVNLLQPQDRRSGHAGDLPDATHARARLLDAGVGQQLLQEVADRALQASATVGRRRPVVADLGCGSGHLLGMMAQHTPVEAVGLDLSVTAVRDAARRWPPLTWVVANVDRRIPLLSDSADVICSVHARRNPAECARALRPTGLLVVAAPAEDDLAELRAWITAEPAPRARRDRLLREHAPWFELTAHHEVRERHVLERPELLDLLSATYRGRRHTAAYRAAGLTRLEVTLAGDIFIFRCGESMARANSPRTSRHAATTRGRPGTSSSAIDANSPDTRRESRTYSIPCRTRQTAVPPGQDHGTPSGMTTAAASSRPGTGHVPTTPPLIVSVSSPECHSTAPSSSAGGRASVGPGCRGDRGRASSSE